MNNDYDRDEATPETTREDVAAATKLLLLLNGDEIISQVETSMDGESYTLTDPRIVKVEGTTVDGDNVSTSIAYSTWLPLSGTRRITVKSSFFVCVTEPMPSLVENYINEFVPINE